MRGATITVFLLAAALAGCQQHVDNPTSTEYPCGTRGHRCGGGSCCWNGDECGGDVGSCPVGMCCADGTGLTATSGPSGNYPQWRAE